MLKIGEFLVISVDSMSYKVNGSVTVAGLLCKLPLCLPCPTRLTLSNTTLTEQHSLSTSGFPAVWPHNYQTNNRGMQMPDGRDAGMWLGRYSKSSSFAGNPIKPAVITSFVAYLPRPVTYSIVCTQDQGARFDQQWSENMFAQDKEVKRDTVPGVCGRDSSVSLLSLSLPKTQFVIQILLNTLISNTTD